MGCGVKGSEQNVCESVDGRDEWNVRSAVHVGSGGTYYHRPFANTDLSCSCILHVALLSRFAVL